MESSRKDGAKRRLHRPDGNGATDGWYSWILSFLVADAKRKPQHRT